MSKIQTDIFNYKSKEFFINLNREKDIPDSKDKSYGDFVSYEKDKCRRGLNINGVFIPGRLYYHLNYHKISLDSVDEYGKDVRSIATPSFRDNEWILFNAYENCVKEKEAFVLGGARQISKSESLCSLTLYEINLYLNSECLLLFTNAPDKQTFTKKAQVALQNGEKFMMRPLIDNNWKNTEIRFGITNKDNTTNVIGRLFMYNTDGGNSTEIGAGKALLHGSKLYYADREGVIEDAKVGDKIFGVDGNLTTITGVYPQGEVDIYEITFSDGRIAKCCKDHLWVVKEDRNKSFKVLSTKEMLDLEINYYLPEVQFTSELTLFALKHKIQIRLYEPQIVKIKYFGKGKATCISVDNESKLFLTDDFIPTHNTLSFFAYDEIAKEQFRESYDAVIPAIRGANGFRNPPFLAFTGGSVEKSKDAEGLFFNPKSGYAKAFINEGKETGFFMGGTYRQDFKNECKFGEYLAKQNIKIPPKSELYNLKFKYSDVERANKTLDLEQENASKDKDPKTLLKHKMYNPRTIKEMFLKNDTKYFPTEKLKQHKEYLDANPIGEAVELVQNVHTKEIVVKPSKRLVIKEYPIKNKYIDLDAPMVIYDKPKYRNFGLHVIGVDCIREDETSSSDSLASFYIGRRNHTDLTDNFRSKIVASYAGRPKTVKEFHKLIELAAEYYNATILYEHTDRAFLDYFETRNKAHLLIDTIPMQREINHNSKTQNSKGLKPTVGNKLFLLNQALNYTNDELEDDNLGLTRIPDPMLAEELIEYDGDKNTDRYIAFSHMVAAMGYYDKFGVVNTTFDQENMEEEIANFKKSKTMFNFSNNNKRSAFGFI